jgi:hypothetical protein
MAILLVIGLCLGGCGVTGWGTYQGFGYHCMYVTSDETECTEEHLTGRASATVTDDAEGDEVIVTWQHDGTDVSGELNWPASRPKPKTGDTIDIVYNEAVNEVNDSAIPVELIEMDQSERRAYPNQDIYATTAGVDWTHPGVLIGGGMMGLAGLLAILLPLFGVRWRKPTPPPAQYGPPQYGAPQQQYGAPQQQYGAPPPQQYGAPPPPYGGGKTRT